MFKSDQVIEKLNKVLYDVGILDVIKMDDSIYVGGSLPSYLVSRVMLESSSDDDKVVVNDIDLYTTNYVKTVRHFNKHLGDKINEIKRTGVNITFLIKDIPIQIITAEFKSFHDEVLANYDTNLVSIGFYPFKKRTNCS